MFPVLPKRNAKCLCQAYCTLRIWDFSAHPLRRARDSDNGHRCQLSGPRSMELWGKSWAAGWGVGEPGQGLSEDTGFTSEV